MPYIKTNPQQMTDLNIKLYCKSPTTTATTTTKTRAVVSRRNWKQEGSEWGY